MNFSIDVLILVLGVVGFLVLLGGCLVVTAYLVCDNLAARPSPRNAPPDDVLTDSPPGTRWSIHLLVVLLGGALLSVQSVIWLWHHVTPARPLMVATAGSAADAKTSRVNLFPWE